MLCRRIFPALVAIAALAPAAGASAASCPGADTAISSATLDSAKTTVLCIVNAERDARGLPTLVENDKLALAAQRHTDDMVARNFFSHFAPLPTVFGVDPGARISAAGYDWQSYGENITIGQVTPREVMTDWLQSPGHCQNLLRPGVTQLGVGTADTPATLDQPVGGTWTQDFANPQGTVAPAASRAPQAGCLPSGYPALIGLDAAKQPDADPSTPSSGDSGAGSQASGAGSQASGDSSHASGGGSMSIDITTSPRDPATSSAPRLDVTLRHFGTTLAVNGAVRPA